MTPEVRAALADCAASLLLAFVFVTFTLLTVLAFLAVRGLQAARRAAPAHLLQIVALARGVTTRVEETTVAVVEPQVRLASGWAGLRAGARVLLTRPTGQSGVGKRDDERT